MKKGAVPIILVVLAVAGLVAVGIVSSLGRKVNPVREAAQKASQVIAGGAGFNFPADVPGRENLDKLQQGCPSKDCIPSIDEPKFESVPAADTWLEDSDIVFTLDYKSEARAYPQRILNWHEIVNDVVAGDPLAITFCPLCGSSLAFARQVGDQTLEFGVSGKLHNNDLVMYDRQTESLWQQITGEVIVGQLFGEELKQIPMSGMRWSQFKSEFPQGQVLSRDTGFSRDYARYPYGTYEQDQSTLFPVEGGVDQTIHPKTVVYGIEIDGQAKAYPEEKIETEGEIEDKVNGIGVEILYNGGDVTAKNIETGEEIAATRLFWFAWKAFHPDTQLY